MHAAVVPDTIAPDTMVGVSSFEIRPRNGRWHPDPRGEAGWRWFDDDEDDWANITHPGLAERASAGASVVASVVAAATFSLVLGLGLLVASLVAAFHPLVPFAVAAASATVAVKSASAVGVGVFFQSLGPLAAGLPEEPERPPVRVPRAVRVVVGVVFGLLYVASWLLTLSFYGG